MLSRLQDKEPDERVVCPRRMSNYGNVVDVTNECIREKCAWYITEARCCAVVVQAMQVIR